MPIPELRELQKQLNLVKGMNLGKLLSSGDIKLKWISKEDRKIQMDMLIIDSEITGFLKWLIHYFPRMYFTIAATKLLHAVDS